MGSSDGRVRVSVCGEEGVVMAAQQKGTLRRLLFQRECIVDCHLAGSKTAFPPLETLLHFDVVECENKQWSRH